MNYEMNLMFFYGCYVLPINIDRIYLTHGSSLLGLFQCNGLGTLLKLGLSLQSHDSTSPLTHEFGVLVELFVTQVLEDLELRLVLLVDLGEGNDGSGLLVDESSETGLVLDDEEGDLHLTAEGRKPEDKLDGVNIACDENKGSLLLLDKSSDVLQTKLQLARNLSRCLLSGSGSSGSVLNTLLLGGGSLRTVLVQQIEDTGGLVLSNGLGELVDGRRDLKTLVKDGTLTLDAHVLGPADEAAEVTSSGADVSSDAEGAWAGGEEGVGLGDLLDGGGLSLAGGFLCHGEDVGGFDDLVVRGLR